MKLKILNYIKYGRYRPLNLVESFMAQLISLFCIKKSKNYSFHVLRYKKSPASTRYYNKLGRAIIMILNFVTIILFNKIFIKGIGSQEEVYRKQNIGDDFSTWPNTYKIDYSQKKIMDKEQEEIKNKINLQYKYSLKNKEKSDLPFWIENRKLFKQNFFNEKEEIIFDKLKNFRNSNIEFSSHLLSSHNIDNLETRSNKLKALEIFNIYHKVAELVDEDIILNLSDNNIGNAKFIHYRKQLINERILRQGYFLSQLRNFTKLDKRENNIFCDIGHGYGLLASILKKEFSSSKFILVDLPELNILSYFFLKMLFPKSKICLSYEIKDIAKINRDLIDQYDFMILEQSDLKKLDDNLVECFINTASLGEMSNKDQVFYIEQIERISKKYFYSVNRFRSDNVHFSSTSNYYDFKLNEQKWITKLYKFSPTLHLEVMLEKTHLDK